MNAIKHWTPVPFTHPGAERRERGPIPVDPHVKTQRSRIGERYYSVSTPSDLRPPKAPSCGSISRRLNPPIIGTVGALVADSPEYSLTAYSHACDHARVAIGVSAAWLGNMAGWYALIDDFWPSGDYFDQLQESSDAYFDLCLQSIDAIASCSSC